MKRRVVADSVDEILVYGPPVTEPRYTLYPNNVGEVLASHTTSTECDCGAKPVPERGTVRTVVPLVAKLMFPLTVPAAAGVNTTATFTLCPASRLKGVVTPALKPVPATLSCVMVMAVPPVLVTLIVWLVVVFSARLPNPTLLGAAASDAGTGVGAGVGAGLIAEVVDPPPPHPLAMSANENRTNESEICRAEIMLFVKGSSSSRMSKCVSVLGLFGGKDGPESFHPRKSGPDKSLTVMSVTTSSLRQLPLKT